MNLQDRINQLETAIREHRKQKADDRCIEDDDLLYAALGDGIKCDRAVGSKEETLKNCARFIERRCEGGKWPSYSELEKENEQLRASVNVSMLGDFFSRWLEERGYYVAELPVAELPVAQWRQDFEVWAWGKDAVPGAKRLPWHARKRLTKDGDTWYITDSNGAIIYSSTDHPYLDRDHVEFIVAAVNATIVDRRAPVQGDSHIPAGQPGCGPGTISWDEYLLAMAKYAQMHGTMQSAERLAERGGFGYTELVTYYLGRKPETWRPLR